jgi:hypothetical protein
MFRTPPVWPSVGVGAIAEEPHTGLDGGAGQARSNSFWLRFGTQWNLTSCVFNNILASVVLFCVFSSDSHTPEWLSPRRKPGPNSRPHEPTEGWKLAIFRTFLGLRAGHKKRSWHGVAPAKAGAHVPDEADSSFRGLSPCLLESYGRQAEGSRPQGGNDAVGVVLGGAAASRARCGSNFLTLWPLNLLTPACGAHRRVR